MMQVLSPQNVASRLKEYSPDSSIEENPAGLVVKAESLHEIASFLKNTAEYDFDYLASVTGVDYKEYFEVVYHLVSLTHNHSLVLRTRCHNREKPKVPSLVGLWQGADFQEREIYDLLGIEFTGHPNLKRLFLWEGFPGHPLRKDFKHDL
jgi:NADH-quinone oxidoreductase subunit C